MKLKPFLIVPIVLLSTISFAQKTQTIQEAADRARAAVTIDYKAIGAPLPVIRAVTPTKKVITNQTLKNDANLFVMLFNPTCEHCEDMTMALEKNIFLFKNSKIVLIAGEMMMPYLNGFITGLKTNQFPTLQIAVDSSKLIDKTFNYNNLPQISVYDKNRTLIKTFNGIETIDSLKQYIE